MENVDPEKGFSQREDHQALRGRKKRIYPGGLSLSALKGGQKEGGKVFLIAGLSL